jgi:hypothetical protein
MRRLCLLVACSLLFALFGGLASSDVRAAEPESRLFELRTYHVLPGRMPALLRRFREHTTEIFEKHGMTNVGYWTPAGKEGESTLIYLLAHDGRAAAEKSWKGFRDDPVWQKVRAESEKDGKIVEKVDSVFLTPTDFSKLK